jgi:hypothetical protein
MVLVFSLFVEAEQAVGQRPVQVTPEDINSRITELRSLGSNVPENEVLIYEENRSLSEELSRYRAQMRRLRASDSTLVLYDSLRQQAIQLFQSITALNCAVAEGPPEAVRIRGELASLRDAINASYPGMRQDPWQTLAIPDDTVPESVTCERLKNAVTDVNRQQQLTQFIQTLRAEAVVEAQQNSKTADQLSALIKLVEERQGTLQKQANERSTQQKLGNNLWLVILVIGILSIGAIVAVKLFSENLQIEWVASGQVIQFVTVMILLSVIMALGLAGILKENTLGALLGGIAGHVLSQGVGRAAAREATRKSNRTEPPPPTST